MPEISVISTFGRRKAVCAIAPEVLIAALSPSQRAGMAKAFRPAKAMVVDRSAVDQRVKVLAAAVSDDPDLKFSADAALQILADQHFESLSGEQIVKMLKNSPRPDPCEAARIAVRHEIAKSRGMTIEQYEAQFSRDESRDARADADAVWERAFAAQDKGIDA